MPTLRDADQRPVHTWDQETGSWRPKREPSRDLSDEEQLVERVHRLYDEYRERAILHERWMRCLSFLLGYQWSVYNPRTNRVSSIPNDREVTRLTINRLKDVGRLYQARICGQLPTVLVIPGTRERVDINAAQVAEGVKDYLWVQHNMQDIEAELALLGYTYGGGFLHWRWDRDAGLHYEHPYTGADTVEGDMAVEAVPYHEITPDRTAKNVKECRYIIRTKVEERERVMERHPDGPVGKGHFPSSGPGEPMIGTVWDAFLGGPAPHLGLWGSTTDTRDRVRVHYYFERPTRKYPRGRRAVVCEDMLLETGELSALPPRVEGDRRSLELPFSHFLHLHVPGSFWGVGLVEDLIEPQYNYNKRRSQMAHATQLMAWPKYGVPFGSPAMASNRLTSEAGEKVPLRPGESISAIPTPTIGPDAYREIDLLLKDFEDISGMHEVSRTASPPGGVTSGLAIQQLLEVDNSRNARTTKSFAECTVEAARGMLWLAQNGYSMPRTTAVIGKGKETEYLDWSGADLQGNYDVRLQEASGLSMFKTVRQQFLMSLYDKGVIEQDARGKRALLRYLDVGQLDELRETQELDRKRAREEDRKMEKSPEWIAPKDYEDHLEHIDEHNLRRKESDYPWWSTECKENHARHINEHGFLYMKMSAVAAGSVPVGGEPGEAPAPGAEVAAPEEAPPPEAAPPESPPPPPEAAAEEGVPV